MPPSANSMKVALATHSRFRSELLGTARSETAFEEILVLNVSKLQTKQGAQGHLAPRSELFGSGLIPIN